MKKTFLFSLAIAAGMGFASCGGETKTDGSAAATEKADGKESDKLKDEKLSSFMLGGIYFIEGYGGQNAVNGMITTDDKEEIVSNYKELLEFPFKPETDAAGAKSSLSSMWDVKDKDALMKALGELKTGNVEKSTHKAWDYARLVNVACMGYAAGYITKDEVEKLVAEVLPMAKKEFKTWDEYYVNFNAGRKVWAGDPSGDARYVESAKEILSGDKSIYKLLPLN